MKNDMTYKETQDKAKDDGWRHLGWANSTAFDWGKVDICKSKGHTMTQVQRERYRSGVGMVSCSTCKIYYSYDDS